MARKYFFGEINHLEKDQIFVFGSNFAGRHGKGAALQARKWGARYGNPVGLQGSTYAIPTKSASFVPLDTSTISLYVDEFIDFAKKHKDKTFIVTALGTGFSRIPDIKMASLFFEAPDNCIFDIRWKPILENKK